MGAEEEEAEEGPFEANVTVVEGWNDLAFDGGFRAENERPLTK